MLTAAQRTGVHLDDLEEDLDQRAVSLTLLTRLSRVLGLTLDQLVTTEGRTRPAGSRQPCRRAPVTRAPARLRQLRRRAAARAAGLDSPPAAAAEAVFAPPPLPLTITDQQST